VALRRYIYRGRSPLLQCVQALSLSLSKSFKAEPLKRATLLAHNPIFQYHSRAEFVFTQENKRFGGSFNEYIGQIRH
jgi:hypothetical protein